MTAKVFLLGQIKWLSKEYSLTLIANFEEEFDPRGWLPNSVEFVHVSIQRNISVWKDLKAFVSLIQIMNTSKFSIVHSVTPKAGVLSMLASWLVRVPVRLHTFTGQVWVTKRGFARWFLRTIDRVTNFLATHVLVDSISQRQFLLENNVVTHASSTVLGDGSIGGVDTERFRTDPNARDEIRSELCTDPSVVVILFVGRLKKDKGVLELSKAFAKVQETCHNTALWFVGPDEEDLQPELVQIEGIQFIPFTDAPERFMAAADICCLPSYREGFGNVIIEAASCGIPSIGSNIYGLSDAIVDGKTGILVPVRSENELASAIIRLVVNEPLRLEMGKTAQRYVKEHYSQDRITALTVGLYAKLLKSD